MVSSESEQNLFRNGKLTTSNFISPTLPVDEWKETEIMILHAAAAIYSTTASVEKKTRKVKIRTLDWPKISSHFPNKTVEQCKRRLELLTKGSELKKVSGGFMYIKQGENPKQADIKSLTNLIKVHSSSSKKKKLPWSEADKTKFEMLQLTHGNKWTKIAELLPTNRSPNDVKNYWHTNKDQIIRERLEAKKKKKDDNRS